MLPDAAGVERGPLVRSSEQVTLELPVAGPTSRMFAYALDYVFMVVTLLLGGWALAVAAPTLLRGVVEALGERATRLFEGAFGETTVLLAWIFVLVLFTVMEIAYFVLWETVTGGRSPGKMLVGLRVVGDSGVSVTVGASLVRNLLRVVDVLPAYYVVGLIAMVTSAAGQRLGDVVAGTLVIRLDRPLRVRELGAAPEEAHAFRFDRAQAARLGPDEVRLAREALRRVEEVDADRAAHLLGVATEALVTRLGYEAVPPERRRAFLQAVLEATRLR